MRKYLKMNAKKSVQMKLFMKKTRICVTRLQNQSLKYCIIKTQRKQSRKDVLDMVKKVNKENFDSVKESDRTVLLDFYADWCGPCRMVSPIVDEIASEHPEYLVGKIDVDDEPELAHRFGIVSIPTLIVLRNGETVSKVTGARPKESILDLLR